MNDTYQKYIQICLKCRDCKSYKSVHHDRVAICQNPKSGFYKVGYKEIACDCFEPRKPGGNTL